MVHLFTNSTKRWSLNCSFSRECHSEYRILKIGVRTEAKPALERGNKHLKNGRFRGNGVQLYPQN